MGSRIRSDPDKLFELFVEVGKPQDEGQDPFILQKYPPEYSDQEVLSNIPKFTFPCENNTSQVDLFTFVLTDLSSMYRFGYCRHGSEANTCLCIISHLPWFETFFKMLNTLAEIMNRPEQNNVAPFLKAAFEQNIPRAYEPVTIVAGQDMFNFTAPDPSMLPTIPNSRNLTEYYNALDTNNMMMIFASMLHERRIIITSKKLSRVTACIHAAESLLYPMHWQHLFIPVLPASLLDYISAPMPYLIGVHTSLMEKVHRNTMELGDAVIVDADNNEVHTQHNDLEALPEEVSSYLKRQLRTEKVKNSMMESGDAISKAFLMALVRLIGGYRDALKFRSNEPITFDREAFVQSRTSHSMQVFLQNMLHLQIFQQFINGRLELLNQGQGFEDLFENESIKYADKHNSSSKYKEWLSKQGRKIKAGGREIISDFNRKAAPVMSTAVLSVKTHGKKAISKLLEMNESKVSSRNVSGGVVHSRSGPDFLRPSTVAGSELQHARPPRPPPPSATSHRPRTIATPGSKSEKLRPYKMMSVEDAHDDSELRLSYHRVDMDLISDIDIQNVMLRSASAETLPTHDIGTPISGSEEDVSSSPSSEILSPSDENITGIPYIDMPKSATDEFSPFGATTSSSEEDFPVQNSQHSSGTSNNEQCQGDRLILSRPQGVPVPPPRHSKVNTEHCQSSANSSTKSSSPMPSLSRPLPKSEVQPIPAPRRPSMEKAKAVSIERPSHLQQPNIHETPLIRFESSESETDGVEQFDPLLAHVSKSPLVNCLSPSEGSVTESLGEEKSIAGSPALSRNKSSRISVVSRTPAFRRPTPDSPVRPGYRDNDSPEKEGSSSNDLKDMFDPLVTGINSSSTENIKKASTSSTTSVISATQDPGSPESLMHDWTIEHLSGGGFSRIPPGSTLTCPPSSIYTKPGNQAVSPVHIPHVGLNTLSHSATLPPRPQPRHSTAVPSPGHQSKHSSSFLQSTSPKPQRSSPVLLQTQSNVNRLGHVNNVESQLSLRTNVQSQSKVKNAIGIFDASVAQSSHPQVPPRTTKWETFD